MRDEGWYQELWTGLGYLTFFALVAAVVVGVTLIAVKLAKRRTKPTTATGQWLPDPEHPGQLRYFDGQQWTEHRTTSNQPPG